MHPIIGVCAIRQSIPINFSSKQSIIFSPEIYINTIIQFGGIPVIIPILDELVNLDHLVNILDGLLLCGGQDIDPYYYREECSINYHESVVGIGEPYRRPLLIKPDPCRDINEIKLCRAMHEKKKAIMGLCRGMQLINVALGGSLHQEIDETVIKHSYGNDSWVHHHEISIVKNSMAYDVMQQSNYFSSSVHHQCVKELGAGLIASAHAPDNVVEIIEGVNDSQFVVGIQGHPEFTLNNLPKYQGFFQKFIESATRGGSC